MEHEKRGGKNLQTSQKKKTNKSERQEISGDEYLRRLAFYKNKMEADELAREEKEKEGGGSVPKQKPGSLSEVKKESTDATQKPEKPRELTPTELFEQYEKDRALRNALKTQQQNPPEKTQIAPTSKTNHDTGTGSKEITKQEKQLGIDSKLTSPPAGKEPEKENKEEKTGQGTATQTGMPGDKTQDGKSVDGKQEDKTNPKTEQHTPLAKNKPSAGKTSKGNIKSSPQSLPGGKAGKGSPSGDAGGESGAGGGRMINIPNPAKDGLAEALVTHITSEKGKARKQMFANSDKAHKKNQVNIKKDQKHVKSKTPAVKQVDEAKKAQVIKPEETQAEQNQVHVNQIRKKEVKNTDRAKVKSKLTTASGKISNKLPKEKGHFKDKDYIKDFQTTTQNELEKLTVALVNESNRAGNGQFGNIGDAGEGETPREAEQLPNIKKARNTAAMDLSGMKTAQLVPEENFNSIKKAGKEADNVLDKEGIGEGHAISMADFSQAKSEDLRRGIDSYHKVKETSARAPGDIRKNEKARLTKMETSLRDSEQKKRGYMRQTRDEQLTASRGHQTRAKSAYEEKKADITRRMNEIYEQTQKEVKGKLGKLEGEVRKRFTEAKDKAFSEFQDNVVSKLKAFHYDRYVNNFFNFLGPAAWLVQGIRAFFEDTSDLPEVLAIFKAEKDAFIGKLDKAIGEITTYIEKEVADCKKLIDETDDKLEAIIKEEGPAFKKITNNTYKSIRQKLDKLDKEVDKKAEELKKYLAKQRKKAIEDVDKKIAEIKSFLKNKLSALAGFLVDAAYKFFKWVLSSSGFSTEQIDQIINQGREVLTKIVTDPIGFFKNVVAAVSKGFNGFVGNIGKHLQNGLFAWLTGAMAGAGLNLPQKWDMKGIFSVVLQVMGISWANIRAKIAKEVGEEALARAEQASDTGMEIFQQIKEKGFVDAMWDMLTEKAAMIKQMVIDEIKNWLIVKVVQQAVVKILSMLNPAGAIMQAILAIYKFTMWLVNNWERIASVIKNIVSSIGKIALGQIGEAAKFIESTLANFVPLLIDFLARLLNLDGISDRIKKIMLRLRKPIDDLIAKIVRFIKNKLKGRKGKKGKKETKDQTKKDMKQDKGKEGVTDVDRKKHKEIAKEIKERMNKPLPKKPKTFEEFYKIKQKHAKHLIKTYQKQLKKKVRLSIGLSDFQIAQRDHKIKITIEIRANDLKEIHIIGDDAYDQQMALAKWKNTINSDSDYNVLHFLKGEKIPMTLYSRIQEVKGNRTSQTGDGRLSVMIGPNSYSYNKHTVYLKKSIVDNLKNGKKDDFDAVTHEFDHAVRLNVDNKPTEFEQVKSEIFSFHAQMLTFMGEASRVKMSNINTSYINVAKSLANYTVAYGYGKGQPSTRLHQFFTEVYGENGIAKYKLAELIAFLQLLKQLSAGGATFNMQDVQQNALPNLSLNTAHKNYVNL